MVDEAVSILVNHVERFFELLNLRLIEHGENIGSGPLRALTTVYSLSGGHFLKYESLKTGLKKSSK